MTNLRIVIERREDNRFYWSYTTGGEQHTGNRGYDLLAETADEIDNHRRVLKMSASSAKQRAARAAGG